MTYNQYVQKEGSKKAQIEKEKRDYDLGFKPEGWCHPCFHLSPFQLEDFLHSLVLLEDSAQHFFGVSSAELAGLWKDGPEVFIVTVLQ